MTSLVGRLVDKANIIKATFSDLEKSVIKATKHNLKGPKEKHVRKLIVTTFEQPTKNHEIISLLQKRLEVLDWIVVMKTLEVFHRILRDGHSQFISDLKYKAAIFNLKTFKDPSTPEAHYQSIFVQKYSQYIEEKVLVYKMLNVEFEKDPTVVKSFTTEDGFEKIPRVQSQLNALLNCRASKNHINNPIIIYGFGLLLKDSFKLYRALNDAVIILLEHYFGMNKVNAQKSLEIYKLFTKETDGVIQFCDIVRKFYKTELPELQHAPTTLVEAMENYLKELDDGRSNHNRENTKKLVQQFTDIRFDDSNWKDDSQQQDDSDSDDDHSGKHDHAHHAPQTQPSNPGKQPNSNSQPNLFDPFGGFEDTHTSTDALPTFGGNTGNTGNTNVFFNDPFATPSQPAQTNQPNFNDRKNNVLNAMINTQMGSNPTPNPNMGGNMGGFTSPTMGHNMGYGNQFGNPNMGNPNMGGFGNQANMGFGNPNMGNPNMGFGNQNMGGFGNQNMGFGNPNANMGFGNPNMGNPNMGGFGNQGNMGGFNTNANANASNPFLQPSNTSNTNSNASEFNPFA